MILGFLVALFSVSIGVGGGALLVSILMMGFDSDYDTAAKTSLATIIPISLIGAVSHHIMLPAAPDLRYYVVFIPACVLGALAGTKIGARHRNGWLKFAFSFFLFIIALSMVRVLNVPALIFHGLEKLVLSPGPALMITTGITIGIITSSLGIGCGLLIVPYLVIVMDLAIHEAITLSLTTIFCIGLSTTIVHKKHRQVDMAPLRSLWGPALAGSIVGAVLSGSMPVASLHIIFGVFLFIAACNLIVQKLIMEFRQVS
jgi:uncharacterized membrane protein YfcA